MKKILEYLIDETKEGSIIWKQTGEKISGEKSYEADVDGFKIKIVIKRKKIPLRADTPKNAFKSLSSIFRSSRCELAKIFSS